MLNTKTLGLLALLTLVMIGVAAVLSTREPDQPQGRDGPLFAGLHDRLNEVRRIIISAHDDTTTLVRSGNEWTVKEKANYPAALDRIRQLLLGIADLTRIEPKTSNPELYPQIHVASLAAPDSQARLVEILDDGGEPMARLLVGKERPGKGDPAQKDYFVRKPDERQSWLVAGRLITKPSPAKWLEPELLSIKSRRIHKVSVEHRSGEQLVVYKQSPTAEHFQVADLPPGAEIKSAFSVDTIATTMARLTLNDVAARDTPAATGGTPRFTARLETFDGLRVTMEVMEDSGGQHYAGLSAAFDESIITAASAQDNGTPGRDGAAVEQEAEQLDSRFSPWLFRLPGFQINNIAKKPGELIRAAENE